MADKQGNNKPLKKSEIGIGYFKYKAADATEGGEQRGYSYKTSASLIENVIAKKEHTLFSEIETEGEIAITSTSQEYTDGKGKRVNLSPFQMKLVTAFAQVVDSILETGGVKDYVKQLPYKIEERETGEDGRTNRLPESVRCVIDIPELTKLMYSSSRVGGKQTDKVRNEIKALSQLTQVYKFKDDRGGTLTVEAPLITLGKRIKYKTKNGVEKLNKVEVFFEDVFVYEINDRYSLSPITLLQLWNSTGVQTELFTMLLFLLQSIRGNYVKHSQASVAAKRKELLKEKRDKEEIKQELAALRKATLTYRESITSLLERIEGKRYRKGKYYNHTYIAQDLKQATEALIKIGIISEYYETLGSSGDKVCNFVINDRWLIDEANRIKALLPPEEAKKMEDVKEIEPDGEE